MSFVNLNLFSVRESKEEALRVDRLTGVKIVVPRFVVIFHAIPPDDHCHGVLGSAPILIRAAQWAPVFLFFHIHQWCHLVRFLDKGMFPWLRFVFADGQKSVVSNGMAVNASVVWNDRWLQVAGAFHDGELEAGSVVVPLHSPLRSRVLFSSQSENEQRLGHTKHC